MFFHAVIIMVLRAILPASAEMIGILGLFILQMLWFAALARRAGLVWVTAGFGMGGLSCLLLLVFALGSRDPDNLAAWQWVVAAIPFCSMFFLLPRQGRATPERAKAWGEAMQGATITDLITGRFLSTPGGRRASGPEPPPIITT